MLGWIVRILFILAAPIAALFVARDAMNFGLVQAFVVMFLILALLVAAAVWQSRPGKTTRPR